jgi:hypothetical protein
MWMAGGPRPASAARASGTTGWMPGKAYPMVTASGAGEQAWTPPALGAKAASTTMKRFTPASGDRSTIDPAGPWRK